MTALKQSKNNQTTVGFLIHMQSLLTALWLKCSFESKLIFFIFAGWLMVRLLFIVCLNYKFTYHWRPFAIVTLLLMKLNVLLRNKSDIFLRDLLLCRFSVTSIQRCFLLPTAIKLQLFHSIFVQLLFLNFLFPSTSSILPFPMIFSLTYLSTLPSSQSGLPGEAEEETWKISHPLMLWAYRSDPLSLGLQIHKQCIIWEETNRVLGSENKADLKVLGRER